MSNVKEPKAEYDVDAPECPRCKKAMVKRSAKKGKNIGMNFGAVKDSQNVVALFQ